MSHWQVSRRTRWLPRRVILLALGHVLLGACSSFDLARVGDRGFARVESAWPELQPGEREIHLRSEGGISIPGPLLRIRESADDRVRGEYIVSAFATSPLQSDSANAASLLAARRSLAQDYGCRIALHDGYELFCRAPFPRGLPDWRALLTTLDSLRIEEPRPYPPEPPLPPAEPGRLVIRGCNDGPAGPTVRVWRNGTWTSHGYGGCRELSREQREFADALSRILQRVDSLARVGRDRRR